MRCAVFFKKWLLRSIQYGHENRGFIILVLDPDVQMLPWENNPIITKQEVYRMPSAGSQYMSNPEIEKLDNCSATFLMGCSSDATLHKAYHSHIS
ncbi:hypothetical protein DY000_02009804 [Brassica cretica]|uniref:separase n=1 Tax=Brassica cretica TaxID=69181 RepID=A0ABQ7BX71_BRACR|nr:hypothetical protein DY000_02054229 [Brassica cretica]KAF3544114.1 hypothetical protein DY000_02009804 [Brassica cretica]